MNDLAEQCATYALAIMKRDKELATHSARIAELEAQVAALTPDAERYRWCMRNVNESTLDATNKFVDAERAKEEQK